MKHETEVDDAHISIGDENNNTTQESNETLGFTRPIFTGKVLKKVAWMIYKSRYMVLIDDPPKLMYFDGSTNEKKVCMRPSFSRSPNSQHPFVFSFRARYL